MAENEFILWENDNFIIKTLSNPHISLSEGVHLIVLPKKHTANAWEDPELASEAFLLSSQATKIMSELEVCPWFNLQANGNWRLLPGSTPTFHIQIYGRNKTESWGKPINLPVAPGTFKNEPMPQELRKRLTIAFNSQL